ncbi:hypothetical protein F7725_023435 [Dissostichus mawsoni]|uniref:VWFA domain-containing protein n=1 Tax=Dissostichus mawsoni TaxID=36200 RepID=A0A7J5Z129_DISMA|nr:hypothetical protein F7725_023435 [Dissostichus mawsoni]
MCKCFGESERRATLNPFIEEFEEAAGASEFRIQSELYVKIVRSKAVNISIKPARCVVHRKDDPRRCHSPFPLKHLVKELVSFVRRGVPRKHPDGFPLLKRVLDKQIPPRKQRAFAEVSTPRCSFIRPLKEAKDGGREEILGILGFLCLWITAQAQMKIPPETNSSSFHIVNCESSSLKLKDVEPIIKMVDLNGNDLVKDYSDEIERLLGKKMKSVKRLAESAEDADLYHEFNATLQFDYYNSMLINSADEDGNSPDMGAEFLWRKTSTSTTCVSTYPNILNSIYNSEALNDVFIGNFQKDPTLTWQFFGSSTGSSGSFPVSLQKHICFKMYIQAATSPKDIIIMVDISGSMKGLKMTIAKHTINTILDTLGENDFVNVIAPCFKGTLVQADLDNREHFKQLVDELHVKGEAKINKAMKESFKILNEARMKGQGSMCNQAIMLITDGAMEDFEAVFEEFNWPERRMTFAQNTKWIACNNKGYYTHISTLADVQENVMEYLHVLSRPMVINHDHDIIWTEAYMDSVLPNTMELFTTKAQSLLMMTSVAMPVFSKKKETVPVSRHPAGVVGTDIPLMEVMKLAPRYMLGPHGYAFLITNNGYILAHPDLRPLYKDGKKLKPKPNYNSVDMSEVEWEDTEETLRTAMVRGETGSMRLSVRASVDKAVRKEFTAFRKQFILVYLLLNTFTLTFSMVLTRGNGKLMYFGNVSVEEGLHDLTSPDLSIASEWPPSGTFWGSSRIWSDEVLLRHVLFDAPGVETAFLGTRSGLLRLTRYTGVENRVAKKFLTAADKANLFTMDHFPLWYRLAIELQR